MPSKRQRQIERYREGEAWRQFWHDEIKGWAAEPKVTCTALVTTRTGFRGYHLGLITAGQPVQVPQSLVSVFVAAGVISQP